MAQAKQKTNAQYATDVLSEIKKMPAFEYSIDFAKLAKKVDELEDFIDGCKSDNDKLAFLLEEKASEIDEKSQQIGELESIVEDHKEKTYITLMCGIGTIDYDVNGSQWLEQVMELVGEKIKKHNALVVIEQLKKMA